MRVWLGLDWTGGWARDSPITTAPAASSHCLLYQRCWRGDSCCCCWPVAAARLGFRILLLHRFTLPFSPKSNPICVRPCRRRRPCVPGIADFRALGSDLVCCYAPVLGWLGLVVVHEVFLLDLGWTDRFHLLQGWAVAWTEREELSVQPCLKSRAPRGRTLRSLPCCVGSLPKSSGLQLGLDLRRRGCGCRTHSQSLSRPAGWRSIWFCCLLRRSYLLLSSHEWMLGNAGAHTDQSHSRAI